MRRYDRSKHRCLGLCWIRFVSAVESSPIHVKFKHGDVLFSENHDDAFFAFDGGGGSPSSFIFRARAELKPHLDSKLGGAPNADPVPITIQMKLLVSPPIHMA